MSSFTITTPAAEVTLSPSKVRKRETAKGTVTYTVTNTSGVTIRTALRVKPGAGADPSWFTVRGGEERDIGPGATEDFAVDLSVPGQRVEGAPDDERLKLSFHAVAVNLKDSDNDAEVGSTVAFRAPRLETGGGISWWMIAAAAALVILVVGAVVAIPKIFGPDETVLLQDFRNRSLNEARAALTEQGLVVEELHPSGLQPTLQAAKFYEQVVEDQNPRSDGTLAVAPGSRVSLIWEWRPLKVTVPDVAGQSLEEAIRMIEESGLRFVHAQEPSQPAPGTNYYLVVDRASPTGSVDAGTGITLSMRWQQWTFGGVIFDRNVVLQEFEVLRNQPSEETLRRLPQR
ncbi:MAG TPA: PASTA domain-containing protein [Gammaproteobacteria bacterium]